MATVSGNVYLSGQTDDHSGVKVIFDAVSSSATTDSTLSTSDGSYSIGLNDGIYTVHFSKTGYIPYTMPGTFSFAGESYVQEGVTLAAGSVIEISGRVHGIFYNEYQYRVVGDIEIDHGDTLIIEPGTRIIFMGYYGLDVHGNLIAVGTEQDSIYITSGFPVQAAGDWQNIYIHSTQDQSQASGRVITFQYCNIGYGGVASEGLIHDYRAFNTDRWAGLNQEVPYLNILNSYVHHSSYYIIVSYHSRLHLSDTRLTHYVERPLYIGDNEGAIILNNHIYWQSGSYEYASLYYIHLSYNDSYRIEIKNNIFETNYYFGNIYNNQTESENADTVIVSNNYFFSKNQFYDLDFLTTQNNYTLVERNKFERIGNDARGYGVTARNSDHTIVRNNIFKNLYYAFRNYNNVGTTFENNIITNCIGGFYPEGSATSATIQNNLFFSITGALIEDDNYNSLPI
jgi:hypothetical protein